MAIPLIPIVSALSAIVPKVAEWIGGDKAEESASKIADIAMAATGLSSPTEAVNAVMADPNLELEFRKLVELQRNELDKLYLEDRKDARVMYTHHNEQADLIANRITTWNVLYILLLVAVNCAVVYYIPSGELIAIASNLIGMVIKSLLDQVQSVTGFYFGSSLGSKNKKG